MNTDHDNHDLAPASTSEKCIQLLTKYITHTAPRLFALCQDPWHEDTKGWVFAWGATFDDSTVVFSPNGKITGTFDSADSALNLFSCTQDLCLIWVDPTIYSQPDTITG